MLVFLVVLITIVCILLTLVVLVQNPKGGGLDANFGGLGNQTLGVKRTTDFLEKATWGLAIILILFSLLTKFFPGDASGDANLQQRNNAPVEQSQ